ncbi:MAG TPA: hypothetical protein VII44_07335 [Puia sp.]
MISDNQTDKFFIDRLRDYHSSVPADMWNRIIEKKKRDREIFLFFSRLFAVVILSLALTGGYFIFNQSKSTSTIGMDIMKINHKPFITDTIKASQSNLSSGQHQIGVDRIKADNKKMHQKEKAEISYSGPLEHVRVNIPNKVNLFRGENTSEVLSASGDSNEIEKNKTEYKKDSLDKKLFVKAPTSDSSQDRDLKKPKTENKPNNRKWFLDLYASPDYPIVSPHEYEKSKLSYAIGIKLNRSLGKHFSIKSGIQFSQVNIGYNDSLFGRNTLHLMRLDLPVLAGYSLGDEKLRTTFNGGVMLNLYSWLRGNTISDIFKTNTGLSIYLGVDFERKINERFSLFGEPYYRFQLTSMTVSTVSSMKFIDVVGVNLGARYYFKK